MAKQQLVLFVSGGRFNSEGMSDRVVALGLGPGARVYSQWILRGFARSRGLAKMDDILLVVETEANHISRVHPRDSTPQGASLGVGLLERPEGLFLTTEGQGLAASSGNDAVWRFDLRAENPFGDHPLVTASHDPRLAFPREVLWLPDGRLVVTTLGNSQTLPTALLFPAEPAEGEAGIELPGEIARRFDQQFVPRFGLCWIETHQAIAIGVCLHDRGLIILVDPASQKTMGVCELPDGHYAMSLAAGYLPAAQYLPQPYKKILPEGMLQERVLDKAPASQRPNPHEFIFAGTWQGHIYAVPVWPAEDLAGPLGPPRRIYTDDGTVVQAKYMIFCGM